MTLLLGTAQAEPGRLAYGEFPLVQHPIGGRDALPVVLAQGRREGPTFWITAGIHGIEHAGIQVLHRLLTPELLADLRGTVVAIPGLNPAGLRTLQRRAYYHDGDPNRLFPDGRAFEPDADLAPPSALEQAYGRLFDEIRRTATFFFDLHCLGINSLSFAFRDRVLHPEGDEAARLRAEATSATMEAMARAYGHTLVADYPVHRYLDEKLHRSTTASIATLAGIPALTAELGGSYTPSRAVVAASLAGLRNMLRWAGMLPGEPEPVTGIRILDPGHPVRRRSAARVPVACVVHHLVEAGDTVRAGDPLVELRDAWGRPLGTLAAEDSGFVISCTSGIFVYPGQSTVLLAIRDEAPLVGAYPAGFRSASAR
jgi:hypothetical protein